MGRDDIRNDYFNWLCIAVGEDRSTDDISYRKLLMRLHSTKFVYSIKKDKNRAADGVDLRYRFCSAIDGESDRYILKCLDEPCSILEMMVALAIRCEETIMDDPSMGNRTGQWFWGMITNLGLGSMYDSRYDEAYIDETLERFLRHEYTPNGKGGLFTIRGCDADLRKEEIWTQLLWYVDGLLFGGKEK